MNDLEPYELLGGAIVRQAVEDYEDAYFRYLMLQREIGLVRQDIEELDRFFEGDWCNELMRHRLDPIAVRDKAIELAKETYDECEWKCEIKYIPKKKKKKKSSTENES